MNESRDSVSPQRHGWTWLLAPALAGLYPALSLYVQNLQEVTPSEAISCGVFLVLVAVGVALGLKYFLPTVERASIATVWIFASSFLFSEYLDVARPLAAKWFSLGSSGSLLAVIWAVAFVCPLIPLKWYARGERVIGRVYQIVTLASVVLIGLTTLQGVMLTARGNSHSLPSSTAAVDRDELFGLLEGEPFDLHLQRPEPARDIYYLVFDRYANANTLRRDFDFDNSEFYAELEKRGFYVERDAVTCYPMTLLSMSSTLNMHYLTPIFTQRLDYVPLLKRHEVGRLLIDAGYTYHHFGNAYEPLRENDLAQSNLRVSFLPSEFADTLLKMTPLGMSLGSSFKQHFVKRKFAAIRALASDDQPTFAYAHFLLPHYPYVFNRDGSNSWSRAPQSNKKAYVDQLVAANQMILETIDAICRRSKEKPIIILQADEGPYLMSADQRMPRRDQLEMRCGTLSAMLIPDEDIARQIPPHLAPVNTFRFLLHAYFGAPLEMLPDRAYYWEDPVPVGLPRPGSRMLDVSDELAHPAERDGAVRETTKESATPSDSQAGDTE